MFNLIQIILVSAPSPKTGSTYSKGTNNFIKMSQTHLQMLSKTLTLLANKTEWTPIFLLVLEENENAIS